MTSQDSGILSRAETSVKNHSYLPAVTSEHSGDAWQVLPTQNRFWWRNKTAALRVESSEYDRIDRSL